MTQIVEQDPNSNDCGPCVAAMVLDKSLEYIKAWAREHLGKETGFHDGDMGRLLLAHGMNYGLGLGGKGPLKTIRKGKVLKVKEKWSLAEDRFIFTVRSPGGGQHFIYWDKERLIDPNQCHNAGKPLTYYEVLTAWPVYKLGHGEHEA